MLKKRMFGILILIMGIMLVFAFLGCEGTVDSGTNDPNNNGDSEYAGTWESNQYLARIILNGDLTFVQQGKSIVNDPWENIAKGNMVISGNDITMTVTHKYVGGAEQWSNSQSDLDSMKGYFGGTLVLTGTVNGSGVGSVMLGHMVKQ